MTARTRKSFAWLWMAALLSATMGVSVQQVYCYCVGKTTVSLFAADDACQAKHIDGLTQSHPINNLSGSCCKKPAPTKPSCCEKPEPDKQGCTKKTTQVFHLKTEFEVSHSDFKKLDPPKAWASLPPFPIFSSSFLKARKCAFQSFERPPPSLSGRAICVRHGVFQC